jgi:hypothetical protein
VIRPPPGEDAGDVEPLAADPDPCPGIDSVDAKPLGSYGAEHRDMQPFAIETRSG